MIQLRLIKTCKGKIRAAHHGAAQISIAEIGALGVGLVQHCVDDESAT